MNTRPSTDFSQLAPPTFPVSAIPEISFLPDQPDIALRPCKPADMDYLRVLCRQLRAAEMALVPWQTAQKQAFLDSQFALQHRHYLTHFPLADFWLIIKGTVPIGRLYLLRQAPAFHIIDISLAPEWRSSGIGSLLITNAQKMAQAAGLPLQLNVDQRNPAARRLYDRLGFTAIDTTGSHTLMRWQATL
ncbi:GNAT family N-acetyltransferase [Glaciimonas sp. GG7]